MYCNIYLTDSQELKFRYSTTEFYKSEQWKHLATLVLTENGFISLSSYRWKILSEKR